MIKMLLSQRKLPPLQTKEKMVSCLLSEEYGTLPPPPTAIAFEPEEYPIPMWTCAHSLQLSSVKRVRIALRWEEKEFSFPIYISLPKTEGKHPFFLSISQRREITDDDFPTEIIAREGFAIVSFCFADVVGEKNEFRDALGALLYPDGVRKPDDGGKLALLAWAASRALDYALTDPALNERYAIVAGHDTLGCAALLAAATDHRFTHVFANGTGVGGAPLLRGKAGERIADIYPTDKSLFCSAFEKYAGREEMLPFDQHYLLAAIAPRPVFLSLRKEDAWGDPVSSYLAAIAAQEAQNETYPDALPTEKILRVGHIGLHAREGLLPFGRMDWERAMDFILGREPRQADAPSESLRARALPPLCEREEMLRLLQEEEYGFLPPPPDAITFREKHDFVSSAFCAGKAECKRVDVTVTVGERSHTFIVHATIPRRRGKFPFFVCPTFEETVVGRYLPVEEIIDRGYAVLSFYYQGVTKDNGDFKDGLAGLYYTDKERGASDPSKIAFWAWACHRVLDYAETEGQLDMSCACICGHSRLGKTALLAAATDTRFAFVHSNCSGYGGAAITGGVLGETNMPVVTRWFCKNYQKYASYRPTNFDQHYLLAAIAPRFVSVSSAYEDTWANPESEFLSCVAASGAYEKLGYKGIVTPDRLPCVGEVLTAGRIGYYMREGLHYFGREDWDFVLSFVDRHKNDNCKSDK